MAKNITKELIIEKSIELIKKNGSGQNVNLREIARELGCNHTNLYNYFGSLENLLAETMKALIVKLRSNTLSEGSALLPDEEIRMFINRLLNFAFENQGLYRFLWFDNPNMQNIDKILEDTIRPEKMLYQSISSIAGTKYTEKKIYEITGILHSYIHGEISKYLYNRNVETDKDILNKKITDNTMDMLYLFIQLKQS